MTAIPGTNVGAKVVPFDDNDKFATHSEEYGQGGYRAMADVSQRNSIPEARRKVGMLVYTFDEIKYWRLITNPSGDTTQNSDWTEVPIGGASAGVNSLTKIGSGGIRVRRADTGGNQAGSTGDLEIGINLASVNFASGFGGFLAVQGTSGSGYQSISKIRLSSVAVSINTFSLLQGAGTGLKASRVASLGSYVRGVKLNFWNTNDSTIGSIGTNKFGSYSNVFVMVALGSASGGAKYRRFDLKKLSGP